MFRIGEFSRIGRVSARLLRYYDQIALLAPAVTDPHTGYRYYRAEQLRDLNRILVLRELGLSLEQIGRLVKAAIPPAELRSMLEDRRAEVERALSEEARRLEQIESRLAQLEHDGDDGDVLVRPEPERWLLSLRTRVTSFDAGLALLLAISEYLPRLVPAQTLGQLVAIAHSGEFEPGDIDVEMGFFVDPGWQRPVALEDGRKLSLRRLPAEDRLATCVRVGPPHAAHATTARIGRHLQRAGLHLAGANRELFLRRPRRDAMDDAIVEMQFPVEPAP